MGIYVCLSYKVTKLGDLSPEETEKRKVFSQKRGVPFPAQCPLSAKQILQPFTDNGDVSVIYRSGTSNKCTTNQHLIHKSADRIVVYITQASLFLGITSHMKCY